jgi:Domain of unknown function (DUF1707)
MDDRFRASDADRDRATALLRDHFAAGRLTAQELDERMAAALNAKTAGDLRRVLAGLPEPALAVHEASPGSPQDGPLARGYRRLLACYPAWYRRLHEEEMLAVLMTAAPQGKRRPGPGEAADLLLGALRIRCQPSRTGRAEPIWHDALAVTSVIAPLIGPVRIRSRRSRTRQRPGRLPAVAGQLPRRRGPRLASPRRPGSCTRPLSCWTSSAPRQART